MVLTEYLLCSGFYVWLFLYPQQILTGNVSDIISFRRRNWELRVKKIVPSHKILQPLF